MYKALTQAEVDFFISNGFLLVKNVFSPELAEKLNIMVWEKLEEKPDDPSTWKKSHIWLREVFNNETALKINTERYYNTIDDLCGERRWFAREGAGVWPILFPGFAKKWHVPIASWHVEGNWFHHHLNSGELGLVGVQLFTDIESGGGGTGIKPCSHFITASVLAEAEPGGLDEFELCRRVLSLTKDLPTIEVTGNAGDIIFIHPFTLHGSSTNLSNRVRIAANKGINLHEKLNLSRENPNEYSPVEMAIVKALRKNKVA